MVVFAGSMATVLANVCASAFAAEAVFECPVPVGLMDGDAMSTVLSTVAQESISSEALTGLVLEGMNRSAFEAYGQDIRTLITQGQFLASSSRANFVVFGSLVAGPSGLSLHQSQCEVGPILDTDCLSLLTTGVPPTLQGGRITHSKWQQWRSETENSNVLTDDLDGLQETMGGEKSVLWRRTLKRAYSRLRALNDGTSSTPLESLAFGWLLPRAHSCNIPYAAFADILTSETSTSGKNDPRLRHLLKKLFPLDTEADPRQT